MQSIRSSLGLTGLALAMILGCGGGGDAGGPSPILTTLTLTPSSSIVFAGPPGNEVLLAVVARDQNGNPMAGLGAPSFSSDNPAVATVSATGLVSGLSTGTARITASMTAGGVTKTADGEISVQLAPLSALISAPAIAFDPRTVHVLAGGKVNWTTQTVQHSVHFDTAGAPDSIPASTQSANTRIFPTPGSYDFHCSIHQGMLGTVHVH